MLTPDQLTDQKAHFAKRTLQFAAAGYDRFGAPEFVLDQARDLAGPVLDVGTGTGIAARALAIRGFDVVAVDASADDLQVAEALTEDARLTPRIRYMVADATHLPIPDAAFGAATAIDFLHHLDAGALVLQELLRVVRPAGLIVIADFSREGFDLVARLHAAEGRTHPEGPVTVDWARAFLASRGGVEVASATGHFHHVAVVRAPGRRD